MHLVFVGWTDATAGGADLRSTWGVFRCQFNHAVIGEDDLCAVRDEKLPVDGEAGILELLYLV